MSTVPLTTQQLQEAVDAAQIHPSQAQAAEALGLPVSTYKSRLLEARRQGVQPQALKININHSLRVADQDCTVVVFSDTHDWPESASPAHSILCQVLADVKPQYVVANGDIFDGYSISRHPRIGWDDGPTVEQELRIVQERQAQRVHAHASAQHIRTIGNHDLRFETFLATHAQQFQGVFGTTLVDHLPDWQTTWLVNFNDNLVIKHRWKGGKHTGYNNATDAGVSFVTGHTHRLNIRPKTNYAGTIYGIECGTLAETNGDQFLYTEANPLDWQAGFVVLHIDQGEIHPQTVEVKNGAAFFGGRKYFA